MTTTRSSILLSLLAATALALSACAPAEPSVDTTPSSPAEETETPTIAAMPDLTGSEVLTIAATANTPTGALLDVTMDVYYPVEWNSPEGTAIVEYLGSVGDTSDVSDPAFLAENNALLQLVKLTATDPEQEGIAWDPSSGVVPVYGPGLADTIVDIPHGLIGDNLREQIIGEGEGWAVVALYFGEAMAPDVITPDQWASMFTFYGFFDFAPEYYTLPQCTITLTALGQSSAGTENWTQDSCMIGIGD
jgi:hypothetical protein